MTASTALSPAEELRGICANSQRRAAILRELRLDEYREMIRRVDPTSLYFRLLFCDFWGATSNVYYTVPWRDAFFGLFAEKSAWNSHDYECILHELYGRLDKAGKPRVEASFVSKMLASLDTSLPVRDSKACEALRRYSPVKLRQPSGNVDNRIAMAAEDYECLVNWSEGYLEDAKGEACVAEFDKAFPEAADLPCMKKLDFVWWIVGKYGGKRCGR